MSSGRESFRARRAVLVARAASERQALSHQLAPLASIESGLERLRSLKSKLSPITIGAGLGLTALLLVLPGGRAKVLRSGMALFHLAGSLQRLIARG